MFRMAKTIFKNLFSSPPTRQYPTNKREPFKRARGKVQINVDDCIFCGICSKQCPTKAITVSKDEKSWEIDPFKCIICEYCTEKCPKKCLSIAEDYTKSSFTKESYKVKKESKEGSLSDHNM